VYFSFFFLNSHTLYLAEGVSGEILGWVGLDWDA
jgi:hypothetical protein